MIVALIGLGILGLTFGQFLNKNTGSHSFYVIADEERQSCLSSENVTINGQRQYFTFRTPEESKPADLIIIAVKSFGLDEALNQIEKAVKPETIIISLLNGIDSEERISKKYPQTQIIYAIAQGMDGVRENYHLNYRSAGQITMGLMPHQGDKIEAAINTVKTLFDAVGLPYGLVTDMSVRMWGKFMTNCGLNQTVTIYEGTYATVQGNSEARNLMISAFREVIKLANAKGIPLGQSDIEYWLNIIDSLDPQGMPSMRQDLRDGRPLESDLFADTVIRLAHAEGIEVPTHMYIRSKLDELRRPPN